MRIIILYFIAFLFSQQYIVAQDTIVVNHVNEWYFSTPQSNLLIEGEVLYSTTTDNVFQIHILNEENSFILQGECLNVDGTKGILVKDTIAFALSDTSISILKISDQHNPQKLSHYQLQEDHISKSDVNDSILVFNSWEGLSIINILDPFFPFLEYKSLLYPGAPTIYNNLLYLLWDEGVNVLDISNPSSPIYVTSFADTSELTDIIVKNDTIILLRNWCNSMSDCYSEILFYKRLLDNNHVFLYSLDIPEYFNDELDLLNDFLFVDAGNYILDKNTGRIVGRIFYSAPGYLNEFFTETKHLYYCKTNIETNYESIDIMEYTIITSVNDVNNSDIKEYFILQNYPNPFNPNTEIKFSIPNSEIVQIKVYDIFGKEIKTLLNEFKPTGVYEVEFDASNLPSGVYFYRMISGSYSETKKMILLR